jgi:hypothetical protein
MGFLVSQSVVDSALSTETITEPSFISVEDGDEYVIAALDVRKMEVEDTTDGQRQERKHRNGIDDAKRGVDTENRSRLLL